MSERVARSGRSRRRRDRAARRCLDAPSGSSSPRPLARDREREFGSQVASGGAFRGRSVPRRPGSCSRRGAETNSPKAGGGALPRSVSGRSGRYRRAAAGRDERTACVPVRGSVVSRVSRRPRDLLDLPDPPPFETIAVGARIFAGCEHAQLDIPQCDFRCLGKDIGRNSVESVVGVDQKVPDLRKGTGSIFTLFSIRKLLQNCCSPRNVGRDAECPERSKKFLGCRWSLALFLCNAVEITIFTHMPRKAFERRM